MSAINDLTSAGESEESRNKLQLVSINQLQGYFGKNNLLQIYESGALYDCTIRVGIDNDLKYKVCMFLLSNYLKAIIGVLFTQLFPFIRLTIFCKKIKITVFCNCMYTLKQIHLEP
jgi:hypothetical protein